MRVLLLGMNYASTINSTLLGFRENGIEASAMSFEIYRSSYNQYSEIDCVFPNGQKHLNKLLFIKSLLRLRTKIKAADVIHIFSDFQTPSRFHKKIENYLFKILGRKKTKFITFVGSEVRIPEMEMEINPFFKTAYSNEKYEYRSTETKENSISIQKRFSSLGFKLISPPDLINFIQQNLFDTTRIAHHPGFASYSKQQKPSKLHFVHAPSAPIAKGTEHVLKAIEKLKSDGYDFEFTLLTQLSNDQYQEKISKCDVLIDQFIWGWYGVAAIQAMGIGKPVIAYLSEENLKHTPNNPIINSDCNQLYITLVELIKSPDKLSSIGEKSKLFYDDFHSPKCVAKNLILHYQS